jgi:hypothetical protein
MTVVLAAHFNINVPSPQGWGPKRYVTRLPCILNLAVTFDPILTLRFFSPRLKSDACQSFHDIREKSAGDGTAGTELWCSVDARSGYG